jgi:chromosome segregation ATPase
MIMTDMVVEKLVQKVANMLDEISDLNIQVRRLSPTQETLNRISERIDALHTAIIKIETEMSRDDERIADIHKGIEQVGTRLSRDEERLAKWEDQTKSVNSSLAGLKNFIAGLEENVDRFRREMSEVQRTITAASSDSEKRFHQVEKNLDEWFSQHKVFLIALAVVQFVLIIVVLLR